ncbi:ATP-binding protein [Streptomyces zhihengii]
MDAQGHIWHIPQEPGAFARARDLTAAALGTWGWPSERVEVAVLLVSELVTNAHRHAGTDAWLHVEPLPDGVRIAVRDGSPAPSPSAPRGSPPRPAVSVCTCSTIWPRGGEWTAVPTASGCGRTCWAPPRTPDGDRPVRPGERSDVRLRCRPGEVAGYGGGAERPARPAPGAAPRTRHVPPRVPRSRTVNAFRERQGQARGAQAAPPAEDV